MKKSHNHKRSARFHASGLWAGSLAILTLIIAVIGLGFAADPVPAIASLTSIFSDPALAGAGMLGLMPVMGAVFFDADKGGGGGGMTEEQFRSTVLGGVKDINAKVLSFEESLKKANGDSESLKKEFDELTKALHELRKSQISLRQSGGQVIRGQVTHECARHLGAIAFCFALKGGQLEGDKRTLAESQVKEVLGMEWRAALTASDIPLPVEYSGQVVELVSQYGKARKYGTVYPLGAGSVKLPRIGTDPTFGLIAASGTVTEKSPTIVFVTFAAEKFGGLIRLPSEIDADSIVAMGQFLARYAARQMALVEDYNFFASTGAGSGANGSVAGLTSSTITNSKVSQMAATKTAYSDATLANFRSVRTVVDEAALQMAAYYLHPSFEQLLSTFNTDGNRPYNPNAQIAGVGANPITTGPTLDGFPIVWINSLPAYSTSANVSKVFALFGDVSFQYLGVRGGMRFDTSTEAGFATDEILVRALERFTIGLMAVGAVAGLQTAAA